MKSRIGAMERRRVKPVSEKAFSEFAGKVDRRMGTLEAHSERVQGVLFSGTEDRPSIEDLAKTIDTHIKVMCAWALAIKRVTLILTSLFALAAAGTGALAAMGVRIF